VAKMLDFGKSLRVAQQVKGISSAELSRMLGVHRQQINIWRSKKNCRLDTAIRVCDALGYGLEEFLKL